MRIDGEKRTMKYEKSVGTIQSFLDGGEYVKVKKRSTRMYGIRYQPIPINDFINFKTMQSGNEVLLNMENYESFTVTELMGSLINLTHRDKEQEHDWTDHPTVSRCLKRLKEIQPNLGPAHLMQT